MRAWRRVARTERLLLNLTTGEAIAGVVLDESAELITLEGGELFDREHPKGVALDGRTIVPKERVKFAQVLPPKVVARPGDGVGDELDRVRSA